MRPRPADVGWLALAVVMGLLAALHTGGVPARTVARRPLRHLDLSGLLLFAYWTAVGAWRRTTWGLVTVDAQVLGPAMRAGHAAAMTVLVVGCVLALLLALAVQVVLGRS